jgi:hypothetical protein
MSEDQEAKEDQSREVKHEDVVLGLSADPPRVRVTQNIVLSPPSASMGVKGE